MGTGDQLDHLKVIEIFAGIGAWQKSLNNLGIPHDIVYAIEQDEKTIQAYNLLHNHNFLSIDIKQIDVNSLPDCDLVCYSPPCQSFSISGDEKGFEDERGVLFFDALKVIKNKKPRYAIMENVKGLATKFKNEFSIMLKSLEDTGYNNYWEILNTKDFGLPQNRERTFVLSIRNDIDTGQFDFPVKSDNGIRLIDLMDEVVDKRYHLDESKYNFELVSKRSEVVGTNKLLFLGGIKTGKMWLENGKKLSRNFPQGNRVYDAKGIACTQTAHGGGLGGKSGLYLDKKGKIRKLSTKETMKVMGFDEEDYETLHSAGFADSFIKEKCGNSIGVKLLESLFAKLLCLETK